jgi:rhodanese-related sulfurtransferase
LILILEDLYLYFLLFGGNSLDYKELVKNGAQIIDVTPAEYNGGHIKGSKNIPLQSLNQNLGKINKNKPVITVTQNL